MTWSTSTDSFHKLTGPNLSGAWVRASAVLAVTPTDYSTEEQPCALITLSNGYEFTVFGSPDEVIAALTQHATQKDH